MKQFGATRLEMVGQRWGQHADVSCDKIQPACPRGGEQCVPRRCLRRGTILHRLGYEAPHAHDVLLNYLAVDQFPTVAPCKSLT
jgi:hypothetical protein